MRVYRYLFYIVYKRWYKKDRDISLSLLRSLIELSIYSSANLMSILLNLALWFGITMPGLKATRTELLIGVIPMMVVFYLIHYFLLVHDGRRQEILDEFKDKPKKELVKLRIYLAIYVLVSLVLLIGLPWLYNTLYDHLR